MALFDWISGKKSAGNAALTDSSGLARMESTRPVKSARDGGRPVSPAQNTINRKSERMARRELLYVVVREAMMRVGVLSSSYKFKVLSLDPRGRQFLVMMDVSLEFGNDAARLSEIETLIAQGAKARYDIVVTAVYWRVNEYVAVGVPQRANLTALNKLASATGATPRPTRSAPLSPASAHDPIDPSEVAAFKRALASGLSTPDSAALEKPGKSYTLLNGYEDTEMVEDDDPQALSGTQYGGLS